MNSRRIGAMISYLYSAAQIIVNLIYVPILLSTIGQSEYGLFQMIGSIIAYLNVINSTLSAGATRFYCKYYACKDEAGMANTLGILKKIYRTANLIIVISAIVIMGIVSRVYAQSFSSWEIQESCMLVAVLALNLIVTMNNTISIAVITAHEKFLFLKGSMLAVTVIQPLLVIIAISFWPAALTVSIVQLLTNSICRSIQHTYAQNKLGMDTRLREYDQSLKRELTSFSGAIILALIADQIFWKTDQLILGYLFGTGVVAIYSVGSQVVNCYIPLGTAISSVFMPKVSEYWHKYHNIQEIEKLFLRVSRIAVYPLLLILLGFIVFGQDFIKLWAGESYLMAYWVVVIELTPFTIDVVQNIGLVILQVMDKYSFRAKMYLVAAILNIGLTVILAKNFGIIGAAVSSGIAIFISSGIILNIYYSKSLNFDMKSFWCSILSEIFPLVIFTALAYLTWAIFGTTSWISLIIGLIAFTFSYASVAFLFAANEYEKNLFLTIAHKISGIFPHNNRS